MIARQLARASAGRRVGLSAMMMRDCQLPWRAASFTMSREEVCRRSETFVTGPCAPPSRGFASATAVAQSDKIHMRGLVFYAYHGVFPEEAKLGQRFVVDLTMNAHLQMAGQADALECSVDYSAVYLLVKKTVEGQRRQLIEAVAEDIARAVLRYSARVESVAVTVKKPHVAVPGQVDFLGVQIPGHHCSSHTTVASS